MLAIKRECATTVRAILDFGVDPAVILRKDADGSTPLHIAVQNTNTAIVELLLQYGPSEQLYIENSVGQTPLDIANLKKYHQALVAAERGRRWREAVQVNWQFHHTLYKAADAPELLEMIETIWLRNGPLLNMLYPHATPTYPGRHQHLNVLDGLTARNPEAVKQSIQADLMEGGARLLQLLQDIEAGATPSELDAAVT